LSRHAFKVGRSNLANALSELGEHERARELHEQALAMRQRHYEGDDQETVVDARAARWQWSDALMKQAGRGMRTDEDLSRAERPEADRSLPPGS